MQFVVKSTGVADWFSIVVATPQGGVPRAAVGAALPVTPLC